MAISTTDPNAWKVEKIPTSSTATVPEKIAALKVKHEPIFKIIDKSNPLFFPKMAYKPRGKDEKFISFFVNELKRGQDIYTEFVSRDYTPEDPNRELYLWRFNPHWASEYEAVGDDPLIRYLIPVSELTKITLPELEKTKDSSKIFTFDDSFELKPQDSPFEDAPLSELTIRDLTAILLAEPVSTRKWLNDIISKNKK